MLTLILFSSTPSPGPNGWSVQIITCSPVDIDGLLLRADEHIFLDRRATLVVAKLFSSVGRLSRGGKHFNNHTWRINDIMLSFQVVWITTDGSIGKDIARAGNTDTQIRVEHLARVTS